MTIALALLATFAIPAAILLGFLLWDAFEKLTTEAHRDDADEIAHGDVIEIPESVFPHARKDY